MTILFISSEVAENGSEETNRAYLFKGNWTINGWDFYDEICENLGKKSKSDISSLLL